MLLHNDLQNVGAAVLTQSALSSVPLLTNHANVSAWLEDIDKHVAVHGLNEVSARQPLRKLEDDCPSACGCANFCLLQEGLKDPDATGVSSSIPAGLDNASATTFAFPWIYCRSVVYSLITDS